MAIVDLGCPLNRIADARHNVLRANVAFKLRLMHQLCGLFSCSA